MNETWVSYRTASAYSQSKINLPCRRSDVKSVHKIDLYSMFSWSYNIPNTFWMGWWHIRMIWWLRLGFFYEFEWLTWLRLWVLSQVETIITTVLTFGKTKHLQKMTFFQCIFCHFPESTKSKHSFDYCLSLIQNF